ncbi:hypothetical protein [Deinococcus hopiensis]|uniref:Uncharacterized protein n=1 Tax=Deinococcus hopiensis KR-140 TaxID=695939 RepID=A0A1W1UYR4_9DEIO|nr:hypothetical protein [Deinococcus hopiensis]SMB85881.1 hypothetical protein SAMN00790413_03585 [Deinococcus hopiensis KR-140]
MDSLRVEIDFDFIGGQNAILLKATNITHGFVEVKSTALDLGDDRSLYFLNDARLLGVELECEYPTILDPGETNQVIIPLSALTKLFAQHKVVRPATIRAVFRDGTGASFFSASRRLI